MEHFVITISRQFGSMGRTIAARLSEILEVEYYDRYIVEATAQRLGQSVSTVSHVEENTGTFFLKKKYPFNMGIYSISDEVFFVQKNIIQDVASKSSCIIVGRCADSILKDMDNCLNVYIYAPYEARLHNCVHELMMEERVARKMIKEVDMERANYQKKYCPEVKSVFDNKHVMLNSSEFGIEGTAQILAQIARERWKN